MQVIQGAEEFAFGEGRTGALLVHGFTGSPQGLRALGEHLGDAGIAVSGPRLPGHGTTWEDLNTRNSDDWVGAVEDAYTALAGRCDEIFLVGLSFGAALSLDFAARRPDDVAGIVALSPFILTRDPRRFLSPVVRLLVQSLPGVGNDIADPEQKEIAYERLPTSAAYRMLKFTGKVRAELPQVTCPLLVLHSRNDHTAHPSNATTILELTKSTDKRIEWFDRSYHVITIDYDKDKVRELTTAFIKEHAKHAV